MMSSNLAPRAAGGGPPGFSLAELLVVIAVCGVLIGVAVPLGLSYHRSAQVTTGAQQVRSLLNQARHLDMDQKGFACVDVPTPTQMRFYLNDMCTGAPWVASITDAAGNVNLQAGFTVSATANPVFDYLGRALPATTYTITNATTGSSLTVSVAASGRVSIP